MGSDPTTGFHYPGHNYTGPGTNALGKALAGIQPSCYNDAVSFNHDLDYELVDSIDQEIYADERAARAYDDSITGNILSAGMRVKQFTTQIAKSLGRRQPIMGGKSASLQNVENYKVAGLVTQLRDQYTNHLIPNTSQTKNNSKFLGQEQQPTSHEIHNPQGGTLNPSHVVYVKPGQHFTKENDKWVVHDEH